MICQIFESRRIFVPKWILFANLVNLGVLIPKKLGTIFFVHVISKKNVVQNGGHFEKMAAISSVHLITRIVHPEVVQESPPNTLIPNNLL